VSGHQARVTPAVAEHSYFGAHHLNHQLCPRRLEFGYGSDDIQHAVIDQVSIGYSAAKFSIGDNRIVYTFDHHSCFGVSILSANVAPPKPNPRTIVRAQRRQQVAERKRQAARAKAEHEEARDEQIAPRAQRLPVLGRDGEVIRGARVERDGIAFIRSNPIRRMVLRGRSKEQPLLTKRHADAADRLQTAWTEAGEGVTAGISHYGVKLASTPQTGVIAASVLAGVHRQVMARKEIEAI
jgi:hypothetical protein